MRVTSSATSGRKMNPSMISSRLSESGEVIRRTTKPHEPGCPRHRCCLLPLQERHPRRAILTPHPGPAADHLVYDRSRIGAVGSSVSLGHSASGTVSRVYDALCGDAIVEELNRQVAGGDGGRPFGWPPD